MSVCSLDIKKDIIDDASERLNKLGAVVEGQYGYFPNPNAASSAINEINAHYKDLLVKESNKGSFFIDPSPKLVDDYFEDFKQKNPELVEVRPEGYYMGDEALEEQERKNLFFQTSTGVKFTKEMQDKLVSFVNGLGINVEFNADDLLNSSEFKRNPLAAFDVLQKFMAFASGQEKLLPRQVAAAAYTFLGKKSNLSKSIWKNIKLWDKYNEVYNSYLNKQRYDTNEDYLGEEYMDDVKFDPFAHKMAIIRFLEESMMKVAAGQTSTEKFENEDVDKSFFLKRGYLDTYDENINALERVFREIYNWFQKLLKSPFEKYDAQKLTNLGLDVADNIFKNDFSKFIRGIEERDGKLYTSQGTELELKEYEKTLSKDPVAKKFIDSIVDNPYINFKLSGSLTLRKYGEVFRDVNEDLHDIDGVITLDTFKQDPRAFAFNRWIQQVGLSLIANGKYKQFYNEIKPRIENLNWYANFIQMYPNFKMTNAFIGRDHKKGESVTIQGEIELEGTLYKLDFFLRTDEGNYPEIFDNYWKDWKQIFEAKLNMGRSKDLFDLVYFSPYIKDKYKFTNKGFRYFAFEEDSVVQNQLDTMSMSAASEDTIKKVKEAAKKMGIRIQDLVTYAKEAGLDTTTINGVADLVRGVIALAEGKESVALTEEMVHLATAILEQTNPKMVTEMISKIDRFEIYKRTLKQYKDNKNYQLSNGKPDIRKIKKEAVDKLIAELIINENEGTTEFPELRQEINRSIIRGWWNSILDWIKGIYKKSNISIFEEAAAQIITGNVGGTVVDIKEEGAFYQLTDVQKEIQQKILNTKNYIDKVESENPPDSEMLLDTEEASNFYEVTNPDGTKKTVLHRVTDRVKSWYKEKFPNKKFTEAEIKFNELKRKFGVIGHKYFEEIHNRYFNSDGTRRTKPLSQPKLNDPVSSEVYRELEKYYVELIKTLPKDSIIMSEVILYDPNEEEAGTVDFLAIEPDGKTHILDWKFMHVPANSNDVAWFKQGAYNIQLGRYKQMLRENYDIKDFGKTRAIPILMNFKPKNKFKPDGEFTLRGISIGSVNPAEIQDLKLLPVSEETESTGEEALDKLISQLNGMLKKIESEKVTEEDKEFKKERLNVLRQTIRTIQASSNLFPLIDTIEVMRKEGDKIMDDYQMIYKNRPASSKDSNDKDLSEFSKDMNDYIHVADVFGRLDDEIGDLIYNKEMDASAKTKAQKEALRIRKEGLLKLAEEAKAIRKSKESIKNIALDFADKHIGQRNQVVGLLSPEAIVKGLSSLFRGVADLPLASLNILYKLTRSAQGKASEDALIEIKELMEIRKKIMDRGGNPREFLKKIYQKDDKGNIVNKLIYKYSNKFREEVAQLAISGGSKKWLQENIDIDAYKAAAKVVIEKRASQIKKQSFSGSSKEVKEKRIKAMTEVLKQYDISRLDFEGWDNYLIKNHPKDKWYSEEYKAVQSDPDLLKLYNFIIKFNDKAKDIGYIDNQVMKTFLPFVSKGMAESLVWDNSLKVMANWAENLKIKAEDVGYGKIDSITNEVENSIPKYYTYDFTQKDGVNDYSEVSEDLFKNLILYIQQVNKYKYMSDIEEQLKLIKTVEKFKDQHLRTDKSGNVIIGKSNRPEIEKGNTENIKTYDEFLKVLLYDQKYVLSDSDTPLSIGKAINLFKRGINKLTGKEILTIDDNPSPLSLVKLMDAANRAFQLKTLGLDVVSGGVNWFGSNMQIAAQAGKYFTFNEFFKNQSDLFRKYLTNQYGISENEKETFTELINTFMPLKDDPSYELYKDAGMSVLTRKNLGDMLMVFMRKPEQLVEKSIFLTLLQNSMVNESGRIVNIKTYVNAKYKERFKSSAAYKNSKEAIEKEIEKLKETKSLAKVAKLENGKLVIPGLDLKDRTEIQKLTNLTRRISRNVMGGMSDADVNRMSMSIWTKSMMVFKGWIPKLADTRFSELRKVSDDFSVEIKHDKFGEAYAEGEQYDIGRLRLLGHVFMQSFTEKGTSIIEILRLTDKGLEGLDKLYTDYAKDFTKRTGEKFTMSKEDFKDMVVTNLSNQLRELAMLGAMLGAAIALGFMAPDDDEDKAAKNRFRFTQKVVDKFVGELSFFYNPIEIEKILSGSMFPAIGIITDAIRFLNHFWLEITGLDFDSKTSFEDTRKKAMPVKYLAKLMPITKTAIVYGSILSDDFAKEFDITIQKESNR